MFVYRVVKSKKRTGDLSGTGSFNHGGRWNNKGTYMVYTSSNASLALLENIVHYDPLFAPPHLYFVKIKIAETAPVLLLKDDKYPADWKEHELAENKLLGDTLMNDMKYLAIGVKSAVNELELNYLLNPLFPGFNKLVSVVEILELPFDLRLVKK